MSNDSKSDAQPQEGPVGRLLHLLCDICATIGGLVLVTVAAITVVSVIGRAVFAHPILGDVELVQLGTAVCVALFLPYTQFRGGNIIVDIFTANAGSGTKSFLDGLGTLLFTLAMGLICLRVYAGCLSKIEAEETSMLLGLPIWISYAMMLPGLALAAVIGVYHTVLHWTGRFVEAH